MGQASSEKVSVNVSLKQMKGISKYDELSDLSDEEEAYDISPGKENENVKKQFDRFQQKQIMEGQRG